MNSIASLFLRVKHWQIFLTLFIAQLAMMGSIAAKAPSAENLGQIDVLSGGLAVIVMLCVIGWFWALGSFLTSLVGPPLKLKTRFFHFALIYAALYVPVFVTLFQSTNPKVLTMILPFHFFAMYCMFYLLYFVSKSLVMSEAGKQVSFYEYAGPFFLI